MTAVAFIGSEAAFWLRYDREAIQSGQVWRLLTGHLAHLGWSHLIMNLAGLALIWGIFGRHLPWPRWLAILGIGALGTSLLLLLFNPELRWYVGLSGVLHTMFIAGCIADLKYRRWDTRILLASVLAKLAYEQIWGALPGSQASAGGNVIVDAHLYGALLGLVVMTFYLIKARIDTVRGSLHQ